MRLGTEDCFMRRMTSDVHQHILCINRLGYYIVWSDIDTFSRGLVGDLRERVSQMSMVSLDHLCVQISGFHLSMALVPFEKYSSLIATQRTFLIAKKEPWG